ncbi:protein-L-isoaspartate(D-aspartate) O-methyltransferase [Negadavirga shengliensis]|uniref:Protein-L-isoaspartate O-methyltransferase n=1 Tax=Negadavirga shengliensis TaxID=1389218 RepID=A0ABV9SYY4_9BACT
MKSLPIILILLLFQNNQYKEAREKMVKTQIVSRGITDPLVLDAMRKVERHLLVPNSQRGNAYADRPLPIGDGQTISQPYIVAYMTELIQPKKGMKVLEIGTGSGYQAAVLAEIVEEVYTVEIVEPLGKRAEKDLKGMGYENIHVKIGDGYQGWPENGPYDAILVTAAAEEVPSPLVDQLKEGGRIIIPIGPRGKTQELIRLEKRKGKIRETNLGAVRFVPFTRDSL